MLNNEIIDSINKLSSKKIVVVGLPGSGKTTIARIICEKFNIPLIEADTYFWKKNGEHLSEDELRSDIGMAIKNQCSWIYEGHFKTCHSVVLKDAELVIEIDKSFWGSFIDYAFRELKRGDTSLTTKFKKILFVPANYRRIQAIRSEALAGFKGKIIKIV